MQPQSKMGLFALVIGIVLVAIYFVTPTGNSSQRNEKPTIAVTTFPLYEVARIIAGSQLNIHTVVPLGSDPHMYSPSPSDLVKISQSDVFIYSGAGFEHWVESMVKTLPNSVLVMDMSKHVVLLEHNHHEEAADEHEHGAYDPHYWLDIQNMIKMTQATADLLSKKYPEHESLFQSNAKIYINELKKLENEFKNGLKNCRTTTIISNHDAFGYLAHANGLNTVSVIGLSSDEQPSAHTVANIVNLVKVHKTKSIFFEELMNDNVAQTIAKETGAKAEVLHPLENITQEQLNTHVSYLSLMRSNLEKLKNGLECR